MHASTHSDRDRDANENTDKHRCIARVRFSARVRLGPYRISQPSAIWLPQAASSCCAEIPAVRMRVRSCMREGQSLVLERTGGRGKGREGREGGKKGKKGEGGWRL